MARDERSVLVGRSGYERMKDGYLTEGYHHLEEAGIEWFCPCCNLPTGVDLSKGQGCDTEEEKRKEKVMCIR